MQKWISGFSLLFLVVAQGISQSLQNHESEKITKAISTYFQIDRENIYIHFNKDIYLSTEIAWFKGYVIEKKTNQPFTKTANVYVQLISESGEIIKTQLVYCENSTFDGYLQFNKDIKSGIYYIRAYTNFMNNFSEDESSVETFKIVNPSEGSPLDYSVINYSSAEVAFYPEGGIFLEGVSNTIGVKISDCSGKGISVSNATIMDGEGNTVNTFSTNSQGYGKFDILSTKSQNYKARININGVDIEKNLPIPNLTGVAFSVNNYTFPNKTIIKLKTNPQTLTALPNEHYSLIFQKNENAVVMDVAFSGKSEQTISIPSENLPIGITNIILADKNNKEVGERIIFTPNPNQQNIMLDIVRRRSDSIVIGGRCSLKRGELSISVLPNESISDKTDNSIISSFLFNNYLTTPVNNISYYMKDLNRAHRFELDNLLLTKRSKYSLDPLLGTAPQKRYDFDLGLTVKGTITEPVPDKANYHVKMEAIALGLNEYSRINDKNEFYFENILATDSTQLYFSLVNRKSVPKQLKLYSQVVNNNRDFLKTFKRSNVCPKTTTGTKADLFAFPNFKNTIAIDTVTIKGTKKKLSSEHEMRYNNAMSRGFKITEADKATFRDLLSWIQAHGYDVSTQAGNVVIRSRTSGTFRGSTSPAIYIDDVPEQNFGLLTNYSMTDIDEIYINKRGYGAGMDGANGVIRIYSKRVWNSPLSGVKIKSMALMVKNGFQRLKMFENPRYTSTSDAGFNNFGTVHWAPKIFTDENGNFKLTIPNLYQKTVKLLIEGISSEGELISQTVLLNIP